jgi:hypothetical protein
MKKYLTLAIALSLALASCRKNNNSKPVKVDELNFLKYPVSFGVAPFEVQTGTLSTQSLGKKTQALKDNFKYLYYYVAKQSDSINIIKTIKQKSTDVDFGMVNDTLPAGKYNIFIIGAARNDLYAFTADENFGMFHTLLVAYEGKNFPRPSTSIGDNFYKKLQITVSKPNTALVKLDRIVGKVNVKILDAIPAGVSKIVVSFIDVPEYFDLYTGVGAASRSNTTISVSYKVKAADVGKKNLIIGDYFWAGGLWVELSYYDTNGNLIDQKIPTGGYNLEANSIVTFSGKLFSKPTSFNVDVNSDWSKELNYPFEF